MAKVEEGWQESTATSVLFLSFPGLLGAGEPCNETRLSPGSSAARGEWDCLSLLLYHCPPCMAPEMSSTVTTGVFALGKTWFGGMGVQTLNL